MLSRLFSSKTGGDVQEALSHTTPVEVSAEISFHRQVSGVEELDVHPQVARPVGAPTHYPLHRAAFEGDVALLKELLPKLKPEERLALDPQGNTALHVAVLRRQAGAVQLLLDAGVPADYKNARRWTAIDEAVALRDAALTKMLYSWLIEDTKRQLKEKKEQLLAVMQQLPDFSMKLRWELGSPLFGVLLRRYAPDDTYTLRKAGTRLRVDGSLMGIDHEARSLLPAWKRGSFSLIVDAAPTPATTLFVDHKRGVWVDLNEERKKKPRDLDQEVRELMSEGASKVKWRSDEVQFQQAKTWLGRAVHEKVEGWSTQVFECTGKLVAVSHRKPRVEVPPSWEEYLSAELPEDEQEELSIDPLSGPPALGGEGAGQQHHVASSDSADSLQAAKVAKSKRQAPRKVAGKCWMAQDFPMSLAQLMPLLEVVGYANKHVAKAATFIQRFSESNLFPVKVQVPLAWTVYLLVSFREFQCMQAQERATAPALFKVPAGFKKVGLTDLSPSGEHKGAEMDLGDENGL